MRITLASLVLLGVAAACGSPNPKADSAQALSAPGEVKAFVDTLPAPGEVKALVDTLPAGATPRVATPTTTTPNRTPATVKPDTTAAKRADQGRDSVIKFDRRDPRRRVPTIPDTAKPPR
ncbi:MAG: hypothetical protein WD801_12255 [Gemmatimonadaceae bacterium]